MKLEFATSLLEAIDSIDQDTDAVLFHGENFQALSLIQAVCAAALGMCDRTSKSLSHPRSRGE